jgi:hypothetical protein
MFHADSDTIYLGDNGRALCGEHLGCSASMTGRDLSGQEIYPITPEDVRYCRESGLPEITCETCGKRPSSLHRARVA